MSFESTEIVYIRKTERAEQHSNCSSDPPKLYHAMFRDDYTRKLSLKSAIYRPMLVVFSALRKVNDDLNNLQIKPNNSEPYILFNHDQRIGRFFFLFFFIRSMDDE